MVFISQTVEGGPAEARTTSLGTKTAFCMFMTSNAACLKCDQLLLLLIADGGLSFSCYKLNVWTGGQNGWFFYVQKTFFLGGGSKTLQEDSVSLE